MHSVVPGTAKGPAGNYWLPGWLAKWLKPARYKTAFGGRSSGKTWAIAHALIILAVQRKIRVACCREFQKSIKVSAKPALEIAIHRLGLSAYFKINETTIDCINGSHFFFQGMERNRESIRGWEDIDIVWVEEAQRMSHATALVLIPTIRKDGSELWFTWNPENRTDWVWERFIIRRELTDVVDKVNFDSNKMLPKEANDERKRTRKWEPEMYRHVWLGEPNDEGGERNLLPYKMLNQCKEAYRKGLHEGVSTWREAGLDIADQGTDWNALIIRSGPVIEAWMRWRAPDLKATTRIADGILRDLGVQRLYYDSTGVGASYRVFAGDIANRPYVVRPELFGGAVKGKKTLFSYRVLNGEFFARRNIQMGWSLRLRAQNTQRLLQGDDIDPAKCLFIQSDPIYIEPKYQPLNEQYLNELGQPTWRENPTTGKTELTKREEDEASPDMYDATALAFGKDSENGLRTN